MNIQIGDKLKCSVTGKEFIAAVEGCSVNYATDREENIYSNEGVDISEKKRLLDRAKPFGCYVSSDNKHITGWKGNVLGDIISYTIARLPKWSVWHGEFIYCYTVKDIHGNYWYGRSSPSTAIILRAKKKPK
jgi:hypothetical protein